MEVWTTQFTAQFDASSVAHATTQHSVELCGNGFFKIFIPILSHSRVAIPIFVPVPEKNPVSHFPMGIPRNGNGHVRNYTVPIPIPREIPWEKWEMGIPVPNADLC